MLVFVGPLWPCRLPQVECTVVSLNSTRSRSLDAPRRDARGDLLWHNATAAAAAAASALAGVAVAVAVDVVGPDTQTRRP